MAAFLPDRVLVANTGVRASNRLFVTTVAQHWAAAIKLGWLIGSKPSRGQGSGEIFAAAPDGVKVADNGTVSSDAGQADARPREVSGLTRSTVRSQPAKR
jgi:hypothetical protein